MENNNLVNCTQNQRELMGIRNASLLDSEQYQRAKDKIRDIQFDTNNVQAANLENFIKSYKIQSDKTNKRLYFLTIATIVIGVLGVVISLVFPNGIKRIEKIQPGIEENI